MSDLNTKLRSILGKAMGYGDLRRKWGNNPKYVPDPLEIEQRLIEEIEQAFTDAEWMDVAEFNKNHGVFESKNSNGPAYKIIRVDEMCMTKEEWVRQAIKDGWVNTQEIKNISVQIQHELDRLLLTPTPTYRVAEKPDASGGHPMTEVMTGQEWYDRFMEELNSGLRLPGVILRWVKACAKKAAGIE